MTVTDTPVARETDYGRVDQHSSAIRATGDARRTYNRVPDYPVPGAALVNGAWSGGRVTVSSKPGAGTRFAIHIPSTVFRERVLIADVGGALCALPARDVEAAIQAARPDRTVQRIFERASP